MGQFPLGWKGTVNTQLFLFGLMFSTLKNHPPFKLSFINAISSEEKTFSQSDSSLPWMYYETHEVIRIKDALWDPNVS